jgi:hypothetical protein
MQVSATLLPMLCILLAASIAAVWQVTGGVAGLSATPVNGFCLVLAAAAAGMMAGRSFGFMQPATLDARWVSRWRFLRALATTLIVFTLLASLAVFIETTPAGSRAARGEMLALAFVAGFSGLVGYAELAQRYRDDPARLFAFGPTTIYICVNIAAGIGAFALVREFAVFDAAKPHATVYEVLLASFGAIAFFRSSLFTARVGNTNVDIGPSTLLKSLLDASDLMINRAQARDRADDATMIMKDVNFAKARAALPALCFTIVENVTEDDQKRIAASIGALVPGAEVTDAQCSVILGVYLIRVVGPLVLERAVNALGGSIKAEHP